MYSFQATVHKGKTTASFRRNKMWGKATVHVHKSGSGPYSEPRQLSARYDVVFSIAPAAWRSKLNVAFCTDFTNDWEIETTHWQNTHSKFHKFWFPISNHMILEAVVYTRWPFLDLTSQQYGSVSVSYERRKSKQNSKCKQYRQDSSLPISLDQINNLLHKPEQISQLHLRHNKLNVCLSERNHTAPTGWSFVKSDIGVFFLISLENSSSIKIWQQ